jgi:hypothetical protein
LKQEMITHALGTGSKLHSCLRATASACARVLAAQ